MTVPGKALNVPGTLENKTKKNLNLALHFTKLRNKQKVMLIHACK
jgi:hypothetical protein